MSQKFTIMLVVLGFALAFAMPSFANVPPPPVNQQAGIADSIFNNLQAIDCRECHDLGQGPVDGICSDNGAACQVGDTSNCGAPNTATCLAILAKNRHHLLVDGQIVDGTLLDRMDDIPPPNWTRDADNNGAPDTNYACENCHPDDPAEDGIQFPVTRDCLVCHVQEPNVGSVHHIAASSPAQARHCTPCHGDLVDDFDDAHLVPTYEASLITPKPSQGNGPAGDPTNPMLANFEVVNRGACDYCHSTGNATCDDGAGNRSNACTTDADCVQPGETCVHDPDVFGTDTATETMVFGNSRTHHNTGLGPPGGGSQNCVWCHPDPADPGLGFCSLTGVDCSSDSDCPGDQNFCSKTQDIRACEQCHGYDSLHNIALDGDNDGDVVAGGEPMWTSHVGNSNDCEGCHRGYGAASAPGTGPIIPVLDGADATTVIAGADAAITLDGKAFTNITEGITYTSDAVMTAADGTSVVLTPSALTQSSMTLTIPGTTAAGSYTLQVSKGDGSDSNPVVLNVIPGVTITEVSCNRKRGLTIAGSGFSSQPEGSADYLNVVVDGVVVDTTSWTDTQIKSRTCGDTVTVNALFGSATSGDSGGGGGCSDNTDEASCVDADCSWNSKKGICKDAGGGGGKGGKNK